MNPPGTGDQNRFDFKIFHRSLADSYQLSRSSSKVYSFRNTAA